MPSNREIAEQILHNHRSSLLSTWDNTATLIEQALNAAYQRGFERAREMAEEAPDREPYAEASNYEPDGSSKPVDPAPDKRQAAFEAMREELKRERARVATFVAFVAEGDPMPQKSRRAYAGLKKDLASINAALALAAEAEKDQGHE